MKRAPAAFIVVAAIAAPAVFGAGSTIKQLVSIGGVRDNQLVGYGLVVGLAGTGDRKQTMFPAQSLTNLLQRMGVTVSPDLITVKNTAAVIVTATLPPFAEPGAHLDATVSSIGDAANLQGGLLVLTSLRGPDGQVYATAQGPVVTGGFSAGQAGTRQTVNHPTVGRLPDGVIVERAAPSVTPLDTVRLQLREADFTTAARITEAVNRKFAAGSAPLARAESSGVVSVKLPAQYSARPIEFVAELETVTVEAGQRARIVVNERTGTIVLGKDVRIAPVSIMHGNLTVEVQTLLDVSQPAALAAGQTTVVPQTQVGVKEEKTRNIILNRGATVEELVRALNAIGATARDVIAILQSLRAAGALDADVEVI